MQFQTPILLLVFNRPELTKRLLKSLEQVKPKNIFVVADGPRENNLQDFPLCQSVRDLFSNLNWECSVYRLFRDNNLGCAKSVSDGITWFFKHNEHGIILEDDCIANPSFFPFCETLLERYKTEKNIFHISGNNFQDGIMRGDGDYYYSIFNHLWGWATWKRAWEHFNFDINNEMTSEFKKFVNNKKIIDYFSKQFELVKESKLDSWGFRWTYACWENKALSVLPNQNLVSNIGFGPDATHTIQKDSSQSNLEAMTIHFPLNYPKEIKRSLNADIYTFQKVFQPKESLERKIKNRIRPFINRLKMNK